MVVFSLDVHPDAVEEDTSLASTAMAELDVSSAISARICLILAIISAQVVAVALEILSLRRELDRLEVFVLAEVTAALLADRALACSNS
jgi:hypothetical protein